MLTFVQGAQRLSRQTAVLREWRCGRSLLRLCGRYMVCLVLYKPCKHRLTLPKGTLTLAARSRRDTHATLACLLSAPHNAIHEKLHHTPALLHPFDRLRVWRGFTDYLAIGLGAFRNRLIWPAFRDFCFCRHGQGQDSIARAYLSSSQVKDPSVYPTLSERLLRCYSHW